MQRTILESLQKRPQMNQPQGGQRQESRPRRTVSPLIVRDAPGRPDVEPQAYVTVFGDALADQLANGLAEAYDENGLVAVSRRTRAGSGLIRTDFQDWRQTARDTLAGTDKLGYAVIMLGSSDRQALKDAGGATLDPLSDPWREAYAARVTELVRIFLDKGVPVIWVGVPIVENSRVAADMLIVNEVIRTAVRNAGGTFVDLWEPFADEQNRYASTGPDMNGETVRLRASDGMLFTRAGSRKAAHFVEVELKRALDRQPPPETVVALPADMNDPASSDPALRPGGIDRLIDQIARSGVDGEPLPNLSLPPKPLAGPILPLAGLETSPGGVLLRAPPSRGATDAGRLVERVMVQGQPPEPKPGRADDFRWPPAAN